MRALVCALILLTLTSTVQAEDFDWVKVQWNEYGISMVVPEGTKFKARESIGGWGELYGKIEQVEFYVLSKLGTFATAIEIEKFAAKRIGVLKAKWEILDEGSNRDGWKWYKTFIAEKGKRAYLSGYGTGPKGTYLIILETDGEDLVENEKHYDKWYESIRLFK